MLDDFSDLFDSSRKSFPITVGGDSYAIQAASGSPIVIQDTIILTINDVLQVPGEGFTFNGGATITLTEAPKPGDKMRFLFYRGTGGEDVKDRDILETVKVGDNLEINNNPEKSQGIGLDQDPRVVTGINTVDSVSTNPYVGPGITTDQNLGTKFSDLNINSSNYRGPTGIPAVLMQTSSKHNMQYASFWAHSPHYLQVPPNYFITYGLVRTILQVLGLNIPLDNLKNAALDFEVIIQKAVETDKQLVSLVTVSYTHLTLPTNREV